MAALRLPIEGTDHLAVRAGRRRALVRRPVRPRQPDRLAAERHGLSGLRRAARWRCWAASRRRSATTTATPSRARSCTSCARGELAHFKLIPHTPYYGTADATMLYLIVLHKAWRCTGDAALERHLATAERCLAWIDNYGDRDGDGFQEYQTRSTAGYENQGWKDSGEALVYPDGSLVKGPKALVRAAGLCLRRLAAHGADLRRARQAGPRRAPCAPRRQRSSSASTTPSGTRTPASTPSASTARRSRS